MTTNSPTKTTVLPVFNIKKMLRSVRTKKIYTGRGQQNWKTSRLKKVIQKNKNLRAKKTGTEKAKKCKQHLFLKKKNLVNYAGKTYLSHQTANIKFFNMVDSIYLSYWVGKLINVLVKKGNKKIVAKQIYQAFVLTKYHLNVNPLLVFFEILDKIKPAFKLRNRVRRKTRKKKKNVKQFPVVVKLASRCMIALHWLKE